MMHDIYSYFCSNEGLSLMLLLCTLYDATTAPLHGMKGSGQKVKRERQWWLVSKQTTN